MIHWKNNPTVSTFYVTNGEWKEHPYIVSDTKAFIEHIHQKNTFQEPDVHYIDSKRLLDIITLITTDDGILRRYIFEDNVRDFQGNTEINKDIKQTIRETPGQFLLLNNGITVVCDDFEFANQKIKNLFSPNRKRVPDL